MYQNSGTYKTFSKVKSSVIIELHVYHLLVMNELSVSSYIYNFLSKFPKKKIWTIKAITYYAWINFVLLYSYCPNFKKKKILKQLRYYAWTHFAL